MPDVDLEPSDYSERKPKGWRWLFLIAALATTPAEAVYFYTGNEAYEFCYPAVSGPPYAQCVGYVAGLNDQSEVLLPGVIGCAPTGVMLKQLVDVYANFLHAHPQIRHELAGALFNRAMIEAFPC
jgi:hypothetical protein